MLMSYSFVSVSFPVLVSTVIGLALGSKRFNKTFSWSTLTVQVETWSTLLFIDYQFLVRGESWGNLIPPKLVLLRRDLILSMSRLKLFHDKETLRMVCRFISVPRLFTLPYVLWSKLPAERWVKNFTEFFPPLSLSFQWTRRSYRTKFYL